MEIEMNEPFAWFRYQQGDRIYYDSKKWDDCQPLYTHPKEWVGLTDEEITELRLKTLDAVATNQEVYRAIEAKLKEKNT
jgi:hypothetical protein